MRKKRRSKQLYYVELRTCNRMPLFVVPMLSQKLIGGLKHCCEKRGLRIYDYIILPDRLICIADAAWGRIEDVVEIFASSSSKTLMDAAGYLGSRTGWLKEAVRHATCPGPDGKQNLWSDQIIMEALYRQEQLDRCAEEIHRRPVEIGWVTKPEHYRFGSANPHNPLSGWIVEGFDPWS
jgi:putative transposase